MARIVDTPVSLLLTAFIAVVVLLGAQACESDTAAGPFRATGLKSGEEAIYRDEPLVVRFNQILAITPPPRNAIDLRDDDGHPVPFEVRTRGCFLVIAPTRSTGWPETTTLKLKILWPPLTAAITSAAGEHLTGGFESVVQVATQHRPAVGALEIVSCNDEPLRAGGRPGKSAAQERKLVFNAAIDPATLMQGLRVRNLTTEKVIDPANYYLRISKSDGRVVFLGNIKPKPGGDQSVHVFSGGGRFSIEMTRSLRSYDGRTPLRNRPIVHYGGPLQPFGYVTVDFNKESDFERDSGHYYSGESTLRIGPDRKLPQDVALPIPGTPTTPRELFTASPQKIFIRIPAGALPEGGLKRMYIYSIWLYRAEGEDLDVRIDGLEASLAYAVGDLELSRNIESMENKLRFQPFDSASMVLWPLENGREPPEHPENTNFYYDGRGQDLILRLQTTGLTSPRGSRKVRVTLFDPQGPTDRWNIVSVSEGESNGPATSERFLPRMTLFTNSYEPVVTRWYRIDGFPHPEFSRTVHDDFRGTGMEEEDFAVDYQAGTMGPDGRVAKSTMTSWSQRPPKGSFNAVRLRIRPWPNSPVSGQEELEIDSFTVHFTWGKDD